MSADSPISLIQVDALPDYAKIPSTDIFVRLGCAGCINEVCFTARGNTVPIVNGQSLQDINPDLASIVGTAREVGDAEVKTRVWANKGTTEENVLGVCSLYCLADHTRVVDSLNQAFNANLVIER